MIANGLTNAAKFCTKGRITVQLAVARLATGDSTTAAAFEIVIRDAGAGPSA